MTNEFKPDWCLAPAAVLAEWMQENSQSILVLAETAVGWDRRHAAAKQIDGVLDREPITQEIAEILGEGTDVPTSFWLALEHNYRAGLAAGLKDTTPDDLRS